MQDTYERVQAINIDTGEVLGTTYIKTNGSEEIILKAEKKKVLTPEQQMFLNNKIQLRKQCKVLGGFVHMIYAKNELLFNKLGLDKANISRIIYLATYSDYEQKGLLTIKERSKDGTFSSNVPMSRKQIQSVLGLGDTAFRKFLNNMKENDVMFELDKSYFVNTKYFIKGEVEDIDKTKQSYCRLFVNTIRELYEGCPTNKHKTLANVYQLIPFVHYSNNMICHDPDVLEDKAKPMTLTEIGKLLNIKDGKGHLRRLVKELGNFYVTVNGREYKLFAYNINDDKDFYFINPYVVYSGNDIKKLRWVADTYFFRD